MRKMIVIGSIAALVLAGCQDDKPTAPVPNRTVQPPDRSKEFIKDYDNRRPAGDTSDDGAVLRLGEVMCRKLQANIHPDDIVKTLAFDAQNKPTGMSLRHASELLGSAVANLCPNQKDKLDG